jgi:hypothetical protein
MPPNTSAKKEVIFVSSEAGEMKDTLNTVTLSKFPSQRAEFNPLKVYLRRASEREARERILEKSVYKISCLLLSLHGK